MHITGNYLRTRLLGRNTNLSYIYIYTSVSLIHRPSLSCLSAGSQPYRRTHISNNLIEKSILLLWIIMSYRHDSVVLQDIAYLKLPQICRPPHWGTNTWLTDHPSKLLIYSVLQEAFVQQDFEHGIASLGFSNLMQFFSYLSCFPTKSRRSGGMSKPGPLIVQSRAVRVA